MFCFDVLQSKISWKGMIMTRLLYCPLYFELDSLLIFSGSLYLANNTFQLKKMLLLSLMKCFSPCHGILKTVSVAGRRISYKSLVTRTVRSLGTLKYNLDREMPHIRKAFREITQKIMQISQEIRCQRYSSCALHILSICPSVYKVSSQ